MCGALVFQTDLDQVISGRGGQSFQPETLNGELLNIRERVVRFGIKLDRRDRRRHDIPRAAAAARSSPWPTFRQETMLLV